MLKTTLKIAALSAVSLTFLSACGASNLLNEINNALNADNSNTDDGRPTLKTNTPVSPVADTPVLPVPEGQTLAVADRIASLNVAGKYELDATAPKPLFGIPSYRAPVTYSQVNDNFSLVKEGDGFALTVNGVKHSISETETSYNTQVWYRGQDGVSILVPGPPSGVDIETYLTKVLDGTHAEVQGTFMSYTTDANVYTSGESSYDIDYTTGYATIGIKTPADAVASQSATATYTGRMILDVNTSGANVGVKTTYDDGTIVMNVNFDTNMIEGVASYSKPSQDLANINYTINVGKMNFAPTPIVNNGFEGTFTFDDRMLGDIGLTNNPTGSYAGNFFGPGADDIAGVVQFNGTTADSDVIGPGGDAIGIGGFRGHRQ